jgi:hypothetical protein
MEKSDPGTDARRSRRFRSFWSGVLRTERDRRLALAAGRPVTAANLRRSLMRRISRIT